MGAIAVQRNVFIILVVLVTLAFLGLIHQFLQPLFWAAVLSILFHRFKRRCLRFTKGRRSPAALITLLVIFLVVILPLFLITAAVTREALGLYERLSEGESQLQAAFEYLGQAWPRVSDALEKKGIDLLEFEKRFSGFVMTGSKYLGSKIVNVGQITAGFLLEFILMLYILFFFLRDGERLLAAFSRALPVEDSRERRIFAKFAQVSRATIKGTLIVGMIQGSLGGILFWILGINAPVFWGVIMTVLSLLPAIGSFLIWGPTAVVLILTGHLGRGIIMIVVGTVIIGLVDNILRPMLVGRDIRMPDFLILLSTLGGLSIFGIMGFIVGPMIAALFLTLWDMFASEYSDKM